MSEENKFPQTLDNGGEMGVAELTAFVRLQPSINADGWNYSSFVEVNEHNLMTCAICD